MALLFVEESDDGVEKVIEAGDRHRLWSGGAAGDPNDQGLLMARLDRYY